MQETNNIQRLEPSGISPLQKLADSLVLEREKTHGSLLINSEIMQELKTACRNGVKWRGLAAFQKEAIEMICHKLGRIVSGNPDYVDHWADIAGYATRVQQILQEKQFELPPQQPTPTIQKETPQSPKLYSQYDPR